MWNESIQKEKEDHVKNSYFDKLDIVIDISQHINRNRK